MLYRFKKSGRGIGHHAYDGANPYGTLVYMNGTLYGTTQFGGGGGSDGTVYSISTAGTQTVLFRFTNGAGGGRSRLPA